MVNVSAHEPSMTENTVKPIADPTTSTEKTKLFYINALNPHHHYLEKLIH